MRREPRVFISYRREDSAGHSGRIYDRLAERLGKRRVFRDVDAIDAGTDYVNAIQESVGQSDVFMAVIGPGWLSIPDSKGRPRLLAKNDLVRLEIAAALERNIRVIPVLVRDAELPGASQLPKEIAGLARRNAVTIRDTRFDADVDELIRLIAPGWPWRLLAVAGAAAAVAAAGIVWLSAPPSPEEALTRLSSMGIPYTEDAFVEAAGLPEEAISARAVELFIAAGMDPDATDASGLNAAAMAARAGNLATIELLAQAGGDLRLLLSTACSWDRPDAVDFLLGMNPTQEDLDVGLVSAARGARPEIVQQLLDAGASADSAAGQAYVTTPLMAAAWSRRPEIMRMLLENGADPKARAPDSGWTALHSVARRPPPGSEPPASALEVVKMLLDADAPIDAPSRYTAYGGDWTPLMLAIHDEQPEVAKLLIDSGADVRATVDAFLGVHNEGWTPLHLAIFRRLPEIAEALIDAGADVDATIDGYPTDSSSSALMLAARNGQGQIVRRLLAAGADREARNEEGLIARDIARKLAETYGDSSTLDAFDCDGCDAR